ncbi:hypothetical protein E0Z10_g4749 [Xylaria hypoxylon]|uniref:C2H2-type domain-containing protein n=1 Tax=Xylaria hypoxylon TaxID=37992 RepID=A0A4Z0YXX2_9PEZI|nr:hypothetical protein E0Z10_g4749 [Xylaria hypoxylon]
MMSNANPACAEASTAAVTKSCLDGAQKTIKQLEGDDQVHIQNRLIDLRLWADSVGATAEAKASLDWRFRHRPDDIDIIRQLLSMLDGLFNDCYIAATHKYDVKDIISNIDSTVNSLCVIGVHIRRSGRKSRLRKADNSFDQNRDKYDELRAHLACVIASNPTENGRPENEGNEIHDVDYFAKLEFTPIQERLIEANLRRRHRFVEAQRHSRKLKGPPIEPYHPIIPRQTIATAAPSHAKQEVNLTLKVNSTQGNKVATARQEKRAPPTSFGEKSHTITATSASGLDSKWGKHLANDIYPYTCILEDCPTPYNLFATHNEWNDHFMNDHPSQWQCPCCEGDPLIFKLLTEILHHLMSEHPVASSDRFEHLVMVAEIKVMGITECPLCEFSGETGQYQDSPELIEHVLKHVHDFSLYSLPWPMDSNSSSVNPVATFDMNHAVRFVKDDIGNEYPFSVAEWAKTVAPTGNIIDDPEGNQIVLSTPLQLQLRDVDLHPPDLNLLKDSKPKSTSIVRSELDYSSKHEFFIGDSDDSRFFSKVGNTGRPNDKYRPVRWICTLCNLQSNQGDSVYFQHLENVHHGDIEEARELVNIDIEKWKLSMLKEAYWNGV